MIHILYLDRYHLGDPLFLNGFTRDVLGFGAPLVLVHGAGEAAERALEAQGLVPRFEGGVLEVEGAAERALVARSARDLNRQIVHTLNDAGVAAVRLEASGRGLVRTSEGRLGVGKTAWLKKIVEQGAVPVIAALVGSGGGDVREVSGGAVAGALAAALAGEGDAARVVMLTKNGQIGLIEGDQTLVETTLEAVADEVVPEPEALRAAVAIGAEVLVTGRAGLREMPLRGTFVRSDDAGKRA